MIVLRTCMACALRTGYAHVNTPSSSHARRHTRPPTELTCARTSARKCPFKCSTRFHASSVCSTQALLSIDSGDLTEALALAQKGLEIRQKTLASDHPDLAQSLASELASGLKRALLPPIGTQPAQC